MKFVHVVEQPMVTFFSWAILGGMDPIYHISSMSGLAKMYPKEIRRAEDL